MIKVIVDGKTITAATITALKDKVGEIFPMDPNPSVMLTYVVTKQPTSRRVSSETPE